MSRKTKKVLTNQEKFDIMFFVKAVLCNGSTTDSDSVCWGSNPYTAAKKETANFKRNLLFPFLFSLQKTSLCGGENG